MKFGRRTSVRIGAVLVVVGGLLFAQSQLATATDKEEPKAPSAECAMGNGFQSKSWTVDGNKVSSLKGNVHPGAEIRLAYELKPECKDVPVSLSTYEAAASTYSDSTISKQKLSDSDTKVSSGDGETKYLAVAVPECYFQVDLTTDKAHKKIDTSTFDKTLAEFANGGDSACEQKQAKSSTEDKKHEGNKHEDKKNEGSKHEDKRSAAAACPADTTDRVTDITYEANGKKIEKLGAVKPGETVKASFVVPEGCQQRVSLATYEAKSTATNAEAVVQQKLFDSQSQVFSAGKHTLEVKVPNCYFQIDLVSGAVIREFGPVGSNNFYSAKGQLIASAAGGTEACVAPATVTKKVVDRKPEAAPAVQVREVTTTTAAPTTTTTAKPAEVQGEVQERPELAKSGTDTLPLTGGAGLMVLTGSVMMLVGALKRRRA